MGLGTSILSGIVITGAVIAAFVVACIIVFVGALLLLFLVA